ncbi:MAG: hypothetical protein Q9163_005083 [Psora crenata]
MTYIQEKFIDEVTKNDWKHIYAERYKIDQEVSSAIDSILAVQVGRINKTKRIVDYGYDAKDTILRHFTIADDAEDVLARRWFSGIALSGLHRSVAIEQWVKLRRGDDVSLARALGAFDMFILQKGHDDLEDMEYALDDLAERFIGENPDFSNLRKPTQAMCLARYLRLHGLIGVIDDVNSRHDVVKNNLIGAALFEGHQHSLPLITVAIFCCVAERLGLAAFPCAFPFHVFAIVFTTDEQPQAGDDSRSDPVPQHIYMDPYWTSTEIPVATLVTRLTSMGVPQEDHKMYLSITNRSEIVARCARNIARSVQTLSHAQNRPPGAISQSIFYGALWALALLDGDETEPDVHGAHYLPALLTNMEATFPTDVLMVGKHFGPVLADNTLELHIRAKDEDVRKVKSRSSQASKSVRYRVGQVFRHKRYGYRAIITGWDVKCAASDLWMSQMRVHELPRGKQQSFYHVLVEDQSKRYVAEENIEIVEHEPTGVLVTIAGQFFKRWDAQSKTFVSNIRDEYPDD